ncbi:MAG: peptide-methionine (S)-S-oxide reductase MsrA [Tepidiformaceae bacterium]
MTETQTTNHLETATLAGGCFWCLEAVYAEIAGVESVKSGYAGGHTANPTYEAVCSGRTGHAEVVRIGFDRSVLSFENLLEVFFVIHDPTTLNRQGQDVGTQYRSVIFYHSPEQKATAEAAIAELTANKAYDRPIVTEVVPAEAFYPAEALHDDYYARNTNQPYCRMVVWPKIAKFRKHFEELRKPETRAAGAGA